MALLLGVLALLPATTAVAKEAAEFAIRWDPAAGGPSSLDEVVAVLKLKDPKHKAFKVEYFSIQQQTQLPAGYAAIGRERTVGNDTEATYKVRGPLPLPKALETWTCPLKDGKSKREVDITLIGPQQTKRSLSLSCSVDDAQLVPSLPAGISAISRQCINRMERRKKDDLTVEMWTLKDQRVVFEVSLKGEDTPQALQAFRETVAAPLLERHAKPLTESKTELGSQC